MKTYKKYAEYNNQTQASIEAHRIEEIHQLEYKIWVNQRELLHSVFTVGVINRLAWEVELMLQKQKVEGLKM